MKILVVVGTRPNFIKVTRFREVASQYSHVDLRIVHTGQHYSGNMTDVFFEQFGLAPDFFLDTPPATAVGQFTGIMMRLEKLITDSFRPDLIMVVGDVNSTLAAALVANKMQIRLAHVEAGLRSFDREMPEEHNRVLTDKISDLFFITEESGKDNLEKEGTDMTRVHFVGNTMIDTLVKFRSQIENSGILSKFSLSKGEFVLMTMHRPSNVDLQEGLNKLIALIKRICISRKLIFPVHPRTTSKLREANLLGELEESNQLILCEPLGYFEFQKLVSSCKYVITDSGGIQEETTFLGIPCITLRNNTERPVTVSMGTNTLCDFNPETIFSLINQVEDKTYKKGKIPPLWDGHATERIFNCLLGNP